MHFEGKPPSVMAWGRRAAFLLAAMNDIFSAFEAVTERRPTPLEQQQIRVGVDHFIRLANRHPDRSDLYEAVRTCERNERAAAARRNFIRVEGSRSARELRPDPRRRG